MSNLKFVDDGIFISTRTLELHGSETFNKQKKYFAIVVKAGHCGQGKFIPILVVVNASSKEMAIDIAKNLGKVKKGNNKNILAAEEIDYTTYLALEFINDCDPYIYLEQSKDVRDLEERTIPMKGAIEWENNDHPIRGRIPKECVKTAEDYDRKYVLQRYFAPVRYGDKLIFPNRVNMKELIKDYLRENTIELGLKKKKLNALSFYYQLFGEDNDLNIHYNDGKMIYKDHVGRLSYINVPENMLHHLEDAKKKFQEEEKRQEEQKQIESNIKLPSAREKFEQRYKKYQATKSTPVK